MALGTVDHMAPAETSPGPGEEQGVLSELGLNVAIGDIGLAGIVVLIILMILTDRLVTKGRLLEAREDRDAWRTSSETKDAVNAELSQGLQELLPLARATHHALTQIQSLGKAVQGSPDEETSP